ncbi:signal peptidase I [Fervidicoccus sp.]|uniref:signal peptidase I n=1 Tax=Fervidicoccus sp. TaxID=2060324 RepID=UPI003D09CB1D
MKHLKEVIIGSISLILVLLLMGKIIGLPVALFVVSGNSMYPTLKTGDIVVGITDKNYKNGEVVVWCVSKTQCVIHRIVGTYNEYVITKGDNNPYIDPPILYSNVKYKELFVIPNYIWILIFLLVALYIFFNRKSFLPSGFSISVLVFGIYVLISVILLITTPVEIETSSILPYQPGVNLTGYNFNSDGSVSLNYSAENISFQNIKSCYILSPVSENLTQCFIDNQTIVIEVPYVIYQRAYYNGSNILEVGISAELDKGNLSGIYYLNVPFQKLEFSIDNFTLFIRNGNFFPVDVNVTLDYADFPGRQFDSKSFELRVPQNSELAYPLEKHAYEYVDVQYIYDGNQIFLKYYVSG